MKQKPLLIIQMGVPPLPIARQVGEQGAWFRQALAAQQPHLTLQVVRPDQGEALPAVDSLAGVVISGSWSMVTDRLDWSEATAHWLRTAFDARLPLLGVCYGHQLMADALGGTVADNPKGKEVGLQTVTLTAQAQDDVLLSQFPQQFPAYLTHQQSVLTPPPSAQVLAHSERDGCQIIRYSAEAFSVQFHPEFTADIMHSSLQNSAEALRAAGYDLDQLLQPNAEPEWARRILLNFAQRCVFDNNTESVTLASV